MKNGGSLKPAERHQADQDLLVDHGWLTVFECHDSEAEAVTSFSSAKAQPPHDALLLGDRTGLGQRVRPALVA